MVSRSPSPSCAIAYPSPPAVQHPYDPRGALADIPGVRYAVDLFVASKMVESEDYCRESDEQNERLYFVTMGGLIQGVKAIMSYADEDLLSAIDHAKHAYRVASRYRKNAGFLCSVFRPSSEFIKGMTDLERHAELLYAENLFLKVLLGIVYSGDWLAFIKEALNMRAAIGIYRQLGAFLDDIDAAYAASHDLRPSTISCVSHRPEDPSVDAHFRSGVYLGNGVCNVVLSLLPEKLAMLVELFGYKGDRRLGLNLLMRAGGWDAKGSDPRVGTQEEGVRRVLCDMALLVFHLVLSSFTVEGVDISVAQRIVDWNLKRYPDGVFFLFAAGRLLLQCSQPRQAIAYYTQAVKAQSQYRNLHHISFYEIATARLALWDVGDVVEGYEVGTENGVLDEGDGKVGGSAACWRVLVREATWSKAIYTYCLAVCLLEDWDTDDNTPAGQTRKVVRMNEAATLMARVPGLRQKIAGKSIPLEKFVARKARTFMAQKGRLLLPALEVAYLFQAIAHAPRQVIARRMLPLVRTALDWLAMHGEGGGQATGGERKEGKKQSERGTQFKNGYTDGLGIYWDDLCLARFLEAVCLRYIAYTDPDAVLDPEDSEVMAMPVAEAEQGAEQGFRAVFEYGPKIKHDHYLVYYAHFELGRLLACRGDIEGAKAQFELILAGKPLEVGASGRKGKYSMENALHMRTYAALGALQKSHNA